MFSSPDVTRVRPNAFYLKVSCVSVCVWSLFRVWRVIKTETRTINGSFRCVANENFSINFFLSSNFSSLNAIKHSMFVSITFSASCSALQSLSRFQLMSHLIYIYKKVVISSFLSQHLHRQIVGIKNNTAKFSSFLFQSFPLSSRARLTC